MLLYYTIHLVTIVNFEIIKYVYSIITCNRLIQIILQIRKLCNKIIYHDVQHAHAINTY